MTTPQMIASAFDRIAEVLAADVNNNRHLEEAEVLDLLNKKYPGGKAFAAACEDTGSTGLTNEEGEGFTRAVVRRLMLDVEAMTKDMETVGSVELANQRLNNHLTILYYLQHAENREKTQAAVHEELKPYMQSLGMAEYAEVASIGHALRSTGADVSDVVPRSADVPTFQSLCRLGGGRGRSV